ncbi:hypothetical protein DICPUDRAFT_148826 [Dictyostelium purpureum]|uniref:VWFA domain-containing protein n=1 Tax=Dictyostelium purpureum TaxID=5786 RepID=F0ZC41_DICPU|nr:uncharacterized protein DICPUDRAFT_148826 [Dictyostelium purpureum]EGC38522.1 hypothetical protein DICPUDRAFT_148826 [Dictyostelium purpureum]|eukprot:XP_003284987.1 hypothetical protein DICPUDRAFT_148826 [Dictyostelium purpureum]
MMFFKKIVSPLTPDSSSSNSHSIHDYKEANYYNYYRVLENKNTLESEFRRRICLMPQNSLQNVFKLENFDITSELNDTSIVSVWTQEYSNDSKSPVEANYKIPLSPSSVVSRFVVEYKDKILEAKIKEKSKAKEKYADAIASGGQAFMGEKTDDGLFNFMIGNLPPGEKVTIRLTIVSEIGTHLNSLHYCLHRFMFPLNNFKFNYNLNISLSSPMKDIVIDSYKPSIKYSDGKKKANVQFTSTGVPKNVIAIIEPETSDKPQSLIEYDQKEKTCALALNFYPVFDDVCVEDISQKSEYIFVVDCSGSMSGTPITKAKRALEICVRSLSEQNKFNIYCFGSGFNKVFPESLLYNDESLAMASAYIDNISANLGGTELLPPIKDILGKDSDAEYPRQVFLLTDGAVSARDQLIDYVGKEANTTRMFTFGIGTSVDKELVIGLSKACKGFYEFILDNGDMEDKVMKLLSIANEPTLANIKIEWGDLPVTQSPSTIRPVFNRERMMVYGILNKEPSSISSPVTIQMVGDGPLGEQLRFPITLDFTKVDSSSTQVHTLAAYKQIQDLEEGERKQNKDNKDRIVELGKRYGLVSKHTSYIVTSEGEGEVTEESMKSVNVLEAQEERFRLQQSPIRATGISRGGGMVKSRKMSDQSSLSFMSSVSAPLQPSSSNYSSMPCPPPPSPSPSNYSSMICPPPPPPGASPSCYSSMPCPPPGGAPPPPRSSSMSRSMAPTSTSQLDSFRSLSPKGNSLSNNDPLINLLKLQKANGSFEKNSVTQFNIDMTKAPVELSSNTNENIWSTLLVIAKIAKDFSSQKSQWERVILKSTKWVKQQLKALNLLDSFDKFEKLSKSLV